MKQFFLRRSPVGLPRFIKRLGSKSLPLLLITSLCVAASTVVQPEFAYDGTAGPRLTTQTWPAGTFLAHFNEGDRINTYHRNYFMIAGQAGTSIWDLSNPTDPKRLQFNGAGNNGHRWWKMGDLYWREYSVPEVAGTPYKYLNLANMLDRKPITTSNVLYTVAANQPHFDKLETFPHSIDGNRVYDMRTGEFLSDIKEGITKPDIVVRIGNFVFYTPQSGAISVFDFGDPKNIKFIGSFGGTVPHEQYSTGIQVWRNYLIFMSGNESSNNLVAFDISDPTNVKHGFNISSNDITLGRYMMFQDEFGFTGRFNRGVKYNFEKMRVEQQFFPPSNDEALQFLDNQWMPLGHIVVASGDGKTSIFAHQDGLDKRPPTVGHHFPKAGATNLPVTSTIGFVINETLDDLTLNDQTIQVRPLGGQPITGDVSSSSYQVINYAPRQKLLPNTTYEVKFVEGGIKDAAGNGMKEYIFYFTTGGNASNKSPEVAGVDASVVSPMVAGSNVTFTARATDAEGNPLSYRWDFGDGSPKTNWIGASTSHVFTETGNFTVQVQVSDNNGGFIVSSKNITVTETLPTLQPTQSSPIVVDATNRIVWSVNSDNNTVTQLNPNTLAVIREIPVGADPVSVALDGTGKAWVACRNSDDLYVLNPDGSLVSKVALKRGSRPYGVVFTPNGARGFVSLYGSGDVVEVSPGTRTILSTLKVGPTPRALAVTSDGAKLYVTRFVSPNAEGQVWEINLTTFAVTATIKLPLDNFTVDTGNAGRGLPNYVAGISIHPTNKSAWTVAKKDNILRGQARDGLILSFDNSIRTAISPLNLTTGKEELTSRLDIDNHGQPSAALFSPTGNLVFVAMQDNNQVVVIDPKLGLEVATKDVGNAPQGLAIDPQTQRLFVQNFMSRNVTVFDAKQMISTGNSMLEKIATVTTSTQEKLTPTVLKGKTLFYNAADLRMGTDGYISCASCHLDGTHDGRTWDFTDRGEGFRNTISLAGRAGTGHGNVHWSGNFDEIQDFENDIRAHFNGRGFMTDASFNESTVALPLGKPKKGKSADLDALVAYVETLNTFEPSPFRTADGSLTPDAVAGKALFQSLKCGNCHAGAAFTDSKTGKMHDVGTLKPTSGNRLGKKLLGLDVPTLRDVWSTAPYLHDGSAATLNDVLTTNNATNGHGATSTLTTTEVNQLVAYLQQIDGTEPAAATDPMLKMASPTNGTVLNKDEPVKLSIQTDLTGVTKVEYYVDNDLVAQSAIAPFEASWRPVIWKNYGLTAKVFYNAGKTASITPEIKVVYKGSIDVLFVVGNLPLSPEDQKIKSRLEQKLGFNMFLMTDDAADRPDIANPYDLVLISSSVDPGVLGNDLESIRIPAMTWDPFMYGKMRLTSGNINTGFGFTPMAFSTVSITNPTHPMAAGITDDAVALYKITQPMPFGQPGADAIVIAKAGTYPILFGYEEGSSTPSRRVAFPLRDQFTHLLTDKGWSMFDAAVLWALHGGNATTPIKPLPDVYFKSPVQGDLVNTPLKVEFITENWTLPSTQYKLRFRIDGADRGLITSNALLTDGSLLTEGPHKLMLQIERSNNSLTDLGDTITINVTNNPLPPGPTALIQAPIEGGVVSASFNIQFSTYKWDLAPGGKSVRYFVDGIDKGTVYQVGPIPIGPLSDGPHTLKLVLAEASGALTTMATQVNITVDNSAANLPPSPFRVEYRTNTQGSSSSEMKPVLKIVNDSTVAFPYKDFTIRYWYTPDHTGTLAINNDYTAVQGLVNTQGIKNGKNYIEVGFSATSGNLPARGNSGEMQFRINYPNYLTQNQANDYSYDGTKTTFKPHLKTTLYYKGTLVWGIEPSSSSARLATTSEDKQFRLYPNISSSTFTLSSSNRFRHIRSIAIYDEKGRMVWQANPNQLNGKSVEFGKDLPTGFYVIKIVEKNQVQTLKAVKMQ